MKRLYIIPISFLMLLYIGCYQDNGNYEYSELSKVTIENWEESYQKNSFSDTLVINPKVVSSDENDIFEYLWTINPVYDHPSEQGLTQRDTICTDAVLRFPVQLAQGFYDITLKLTNARTGYSTFYAAVLESKTKFSDAFYVLKDIGGKTDIDLHAADGQVSPDLVASSLGASLEGAPTSLGLLFSYSYMDTETNGYVDETCLTVAAGKDVKIFSLQDMSEIYSHSTMFWDIEPVGETPYYLYPNCYGIGYLSNRGVYFNYQFAGQGMNSVGKFGYPAPLPDGSDYQPAPFCLTTGVLDGKDYSMTESFLYDNLSRRFIELNFNGDAYPFDMEPLPEGYELLFMGRNSIATDYRGFALFKDSQGKRHLYQLTFDFESMAYIHKIQKVREIPAASKLNQAVLYAMQEREAQVMYFVADNQLYSYNIISGTEQPIDLEMNGEITFISHRYWTYEEDTEHNFDYFVVGTSSAGEYTINMYKMIGATLAKEPQKTLTGAGKAVKLQYCSPKMNVNNVYCYYSGSM